MGKKDVKYFCPVCNEQAEYILENICMIKKYKKANLSYTIEDKYYLKRYYLYICPTCGVTQKIKNKSFLNSLITGKYKEYDRN